MMQALRQAFSGHGRLANPQASNHPNNVLMDTAQNLFSKGVKNLNSVKHALQGKVRLDSTSWCVLRSILQHSSIASDFTTYCVM